MAHDTRLFDVRQRAAFVCFVTVAIGCSGTVGDSAVSGPAKNNGAMTDTPEDEPAGSRHDLPIPVGPLACTPGSPPPASGRVRLPHRQYDNTLRALTGLDVHPSSDFLADQHQAGYDRGVDLQVGDALGKSYRA